MAIDPIKRSIISENIAYVINSASYFSNDQASNGEAKGIDDEGKIKPAGSKPR
jgi:hypothetical protein